MRRYECIRPKIATIHWGLVVFGMRWAVVNRLVWATGRSGVHFSRYSSRLHLFIIEWDFVDMEYCFIFWIIRFNARIRYICRAEILCNVNIFPVMRRYVNMWICVQQTEHSGWTIRLKIVVCEDGQWTPTTIYDFIVIIIIINILRWEMGIHFPLRLNENWTIHWEQFWLMGPLPICFPSTVSVRVSCKYGPPIVQNAIAFVGSEAHLHCAIVHCCHSCIKYWTSAIKWFHVIWNIWSSVLVRGAQCYVECD